MATGDELSQTLQADPATYTLTVEGRPVGGNTPEIIASVVTCKKAGLMQAARRSSLSAADSTAGLDQPAYFAAGSLNIGNSMHVSLTARFSVAAQTATIFLALYDDMDQLIGITRDFTFRGDSTYRESPTGKFVSSIEIVDTGPACWVFPVVRTAPTSGSVSIYIEVL